MSFVASWLSSSSSWLTMASAPKSSTSPPRNTIRCRSSNPKGSPAMSAVLGAMMGWPLASIQGRSRPLDCCCSGVHSAARTGATRCLLDVLHLTDLLLLAALWLQDAVSADILQTTRRARELCVVNAGAQVAGQQYEAMHKARTWRCQIQRAAFCKQHCTQCTHLSSAHSYVAASLAGPAKQPQIADALLADHYTHAGADMD